MLLLWNCFVVNRVNVIVVSIKEDCVVKIIKFDFIDLKVVIEINDNLFLGLFGQDLWIMKECGGWGMCVICYVYIIVGMESFFFFNCWEQCILEVIIIYNCYFCLVC